MGRGSIQELNDMKYLLCLIVCSLCSIFGLTACTSPNIGRGAVNPRHSPATVRISTETKCFAQGRLSQAVEDLSRGDEPQISQTKQFLVAEANRSTDCRVELINALITALDKPNLDLKDEGTHNLWSYGAELLGDLKAAEALDLLVSHLNLSDGTYSSSMSQQPALRGVIKMGTIAMPKLAVVLKGNPDPKMRGSAVYCIALIGGPAAVQSLKESLPAESDPCVSRFIRISLDSFNNEGQIVDKGKWFSGTLCDS